MTHVLYKFKIPDPSQPLAVKGYSWEPTCELVRFEPATLTEEMVVGRTIEQISTQVGTCGMGCPGFFGLRLAGDWLVIAIWGAASWIQIDGRMIEDFDWDTNGRTPPWMTKKDDELTRVLVGQPITSFQVAKHSLMIGIGGRMLSISESPGDRPILEGNKELRAFEPADDLRKAVFLSPTTELWVYTRSDE